MSFQKTQTITYLGSAVNPAELTGDEIFGMFKDAHDIDESVTESFFNAAGLVTYQLMKLEENKVMYMHVWDDEESYNAWQATHSLGNIQSDWSVE